MNSPLAHILIVPFTVMKFLSILLFLGCSFSAVSQPKASTRKLTNKEILHQIDSLVKVMDRKKNDLALLLEDFLKQNKELELAKDNSIKGKTIEERLSAVESNIINRYSNKTEASPQLTILEKTSGKLRKTYEDISNIAEKIRDKKDAISEMNEQDMLMLQQMMDKKSRLEQLISNCMKASYEGGQAAMQALKAS